MKVALPSFRSVLLVSALALAACAGGSGGSGTGGQSGTGAGGHGGGTGSGGTTGTGGAGTGGATGSGGGMGGTTGTGGSATGGATGTGGSVTGTGGSATGGTTGTGGNATGGTTGTGGSAGGGATGTGGQAGGSGGAAGSGSGFTPYACPSGITSPGASAIPAGSTATRISGAPPMDNFDGSGNGTGFTNVEGPVWIGDALYFSEMTGGNNPPPSRIFKIDSSDGVTAFYPSGGGGDSGSNGMAVDAKGNLVTANHGVGGIVSFTIPGATKTTLISSYNGNRFNSPNDLTIRSDGTIYFTDPNFQAPNPQPQPNNNTGVYMVPPGSSTATEIISNLSNPNGITLSLDEQTLYVGSGSGVNGYSVIANGTIVGNPADIDGANLDHNNTDGMAIDCAGDLYVVRVNTHDIDVITFGSTHPSSTALGTHLATISGIPGNGQLTNIAFGGSDHKTLYITAQGNAPGKGVFKLAMPIAGMPY